MKRQRRKAIPFHKMSGSGNDFILIDNRKNILQDIDLNRLARTTCQRRLSVGGDGLILFEHSKTRNIHFRWRLFNADGSEAEFSGNGGRCAARLAHLLEIAPRRMVFETLAGPVRAEVLKTDPKKMAAVKIEMPAPKDLLMNIKIPIRGRTYSGHFINSGVPHVVLFEKNIGEIDVIEVGREIRFNPLFQPSGSNVNFAMMKSPRKGKMRTYERGVEDETLACGTGAVATALIAGALGKGRSPMVLEQKSGMTLRVYFNWNGVGFTDVFLEGDAQWIYQGELQAEAIA